MLYINLEENLNNQKCADIATRKTKNWGSQHNVKLVSLILVFLILISIFNINFVLIRRNDIRN